MTTDSILKQKTRLTKILYALERRFINNRTAENRKAYNSARREANKLMSTMERQRTARHTTAPDVNQASWCQQWNGREPQGIQQRQTWIKQADVRCTCNTFPATNWWRAKTAAEMENCQRAPAYARQKRVIHRRWVSENVGVLGRLFYTKGKEY